MYILNLSEPYAIIGALVITLLFIILGKEFKKSLLTAAGLMIFLVSLLIHAFQLTVVIEPINRTIITISMSIEAVMIFLLYISYLWVDDIEARAKNKKSIDNSLDWFWKKLG